MSAPVGAILLGLFIVKGGGAKMLFWFVMFVLNTMSSAFHTHVSEYGWAVFSGLFALLSLGYLLIHAQKEMR